MLREQTPKDFLHLTQTATGIGGSSSYNNTSDTYVSWTFRKQPGFFDVVTWTGNGVSGRQIPHNLGSVPGMIIVKNLSLGSADWRVFHRSFREMQPRMCLVSVPPQVDATRE